MKLYSMLPTIPFKTVYKEQSSWFMAAEEEAALLIRSIPYQQQIQQVWRSSWSGHACMGEVCTCVPVHSYLLYSWHICHLRANYSLWILIFGSSSWIKATLLCLLTTEICPAQFSPQINYFQPGKIFCIHTFMTAMKRYRRNTSEKNKTLAIVSWSQAL